MAVWNTWPIQQFGDSLIRVIALFHAKILYSKEVLRSWQILNAV
jgi:hypothetical protein